MLTKKSNQTGIIQFFLVFIIFCFLGSAYGDDDAVKPSDGDRVPLVTPAEAMEKFTTTLTPENTDSSKIVSDPEYREKLIKVFMSPDRNNVLTTGEAGDGKSTTVIDFVHSMPSNWRLVSIDLSSLEAGASYVGQFANRVENLVTGLDELATKVALGDAQIEIEKSVVKGIEAMADQAHASGGKLVVSIDEAHRIFGLDNNGGSENGFAEQLKDIANHPGIRWWFKTTKVESIVFQKSAPWSRRVTELEKESFSNEKIKSIVIKMLTKYVAEAKALGIDIKISETSVIDLIAEKSGDFMPGRARVDAAVQIVNSLVGEIYAYHEFGDSDISKLKSEIEIKRADIVGLEMLFDPETDSTAKERIEDVKKEILALEKQLTDLEDTKSQSLREVELRKQLRAYEADLTKAKVNGEFTKVGELMNRDIPNLHKQIDALKVGGEGFTDPYAISPQKVAAMIASHSNGVPADAILNKQSDAIKNLEKILRSKIIGHEATIESIKRALIRGVNDRIASDNGPLIAGILDGPSGVGKSELLKQTAHALGRPFIIIDMSELKGFSGESIAFGRPDGAVGKLYQQLLENPNAVIEFREMDQASSDVLERLVTLIEDEAPKDNLGRRFDIKKQMWFGTTNASASYLGLPEGSEERLRIQESTVSDAVERASLTPEELNNRVVAKLQEQKGIRPALQGRMPAYKLGALSETQAMKVAEIIINRRIVDSYSRYGIDVEISRDVYAQLAKYSYDPVFGGRSMNKFILEYIETPLSMMNSDVHAGDKVNIDFDFDNIDFEALRLEVDSAKAAESDSVPVEGDDTKDTVVADGEDTDTLPVDAEDTEKINVEDVKRTVPGKMIFSHNGVVVGEDTIPSKSLIFDIIATNADLLKFSAELGSAGRPVDASRRSRADGGSRVRVRK